MLDSLLRARCATCRARSTTTSLYREDRRRSPRRRTRRPASRSTASSTSRRRRTFFEMIAEQLGEHGMNQHEGAEVAHRRREAVRPRPRVGAAPEQRAAVGVRGAADLPHRPLPRQGDGPEHVGAALRQRHLRAGLEPLVRGPRADHGVGGGRARGPRGLLRQRRRAARPDPEPPAAAADAHVDGAAGVVLGRRHPRREGQGAARDQAADGRRGPADGGARAVLGRQRRRQGRAGLPRGGGRQGGLGHRDVRRGAPEDRQLALGRRAVLHPHRQGAGAQGHRDRDHAQAGAAPGVPAARARSASTRTS